MSKPRIFQTGVSGGLSPSLSYLLKTKRKICGGLYLFIFCIMMIPFLISGCSHTNEARSKFEEANALFNKGSYKGSIGKYQQIIEKYPSAGDRALFEMGIVYAYPKNELKDYQKSLECFQKIVRDFPLSEYRQNSETMIFNISNVAIKDQTISTQKAQIETLQQDVKGKEDEIADLQKKIEELEKKAFSYVIRKPSVDRILIEKKDRRLSLISNGEVLKVYKIALGGNPVGPKERQGDNKTPEGRYTIDSRNRGSHYHLSLHISYPNERDRKRAKELGVSPGGNIMIHGIKNGYSWVGDAQSEADWTKGCIAVTDKEIEEIDKLAPNGTVVEIRP